MRCALAATFVVLASLSVKADQAPAGAQAAARQPKQYTIEQFLNTTSISGASFTSDESRILFSSNKRGIWNAYTVPSRAGARG